MESDPSDNMARLLDKYDEMQRRPFGTNTALSDGNKNGVGGTAGSQMRRQGEAYGRALRLLNRQARRGDARSALSAIAVRDEANAAGYSPGGIGNAEERNAGILGRLRSQSQAAADAESFKTVNRTAAGENLNAGRPDAGRPMAGRPLAGRPDGGAEPATASTSIFSPPQTRNYAGLDLLEGAGKVSNPFGDPGQELAGALNAQELGVTNPNSIFTGDPTLKYRQTLDSTLGEATSPEEIAALRARGTAAGISPAAFDKRTKWWERNRR